MSLNLTQRRKAAKVQKETLAALREPIILPDNLLMHPFDFADGRICQQLVTVAKPYLIVEVFPCPKP